jgi:hypothetical protein
MIRISSVFLFLFIACGLCQAQSSSNPPENCRCGRTARKAVCPVDVPEDAAYRPTFLGCGGNAAVILKGAFLNSFSVVMRDSLNRDRFPVAGSGYGGCSKALADSAAPPRRCSAFKASREYFTTINDEPARVVCFPERGNSSLFSDVRRMTIKVTNSAATLRRFCLNRSNLPLN